MKSTKNTVLKKVSNVLPGQKIAKAKPGKKAKLVVDLNPNFVVTPIILN